MDGKWLNKINVMKCTKTVVDGTGVLYVCVYVCDVLCKTRTQNGIVCKLYNTIKHTVSTHTYIQQTAIGTNRNTNKKAFEKHSRIKPSKQATDGWSV